MFEICAANDETFGQLIAKKYSLNGALSFATEILDCWNVVTIYEIETTDKSLPTSTMIARLWSKQREVLNSDNAASRKDFLA